MAPEVAELTMVWATRSIFSVERFRRIIASVTAAFVLLCGVYCSCGELPAAGRAGCHQAAREAAPEGLPCHSSVPRAGTLNEAGDSNEPIPSPQPSGDACGHCHPLAAAIEPARSVAAAYVVVSFDSIPMPDFSLVCDPPRPRPRFCGGDLPPPVQSPTLLSLRCALNT